MSIIHPIHTPCKQCVFAVYDGITQTGCSLNYLDIHRHNNIQILEAYDDNKEFYVINDKKCVGYREPKWFEQFGDNAKSLDDKIKIFNDLNKINYITVINLQYLTNEDLESLLRNISSCDAQPAKLVLIRYRDSDMVFTYKSIEQALKDCNVSYPWRIQTMLDNDIEYDEVLHGVTMFETKYRFVLSIKNKDADPARIVNFADNLVHKQLGQFLVLSDADKNTVMYGGAVYRFGVVHHQDLLNDDKNYTII